MHLLLASSNQGKVEELKSLLSELDHWTLIVPADLKLDLQVDESGASYAENAKLKAVAYSLASNLPALADDSGLEVEALNGAPGLFSARYASKKASGASDRRRYLLEKVNRFERPWKAEFLSPVCLALPNGEIFTKQGKCSGEIISNERGNLGFGYDSIFLVDGVSRTMAELSMEEKNKLSHRALAMQEMKSKLNSLSEAN